MIERVALVSASRIDPPEPRDTSTRLVEEAAVRAVEGQCARGVDSASLEAVSARERFDEVVLAGHLRGHGSSVAWDVTSDRARTEGCPHGA